MSLCGYLGEVKLQNTENRAQELFLRVRSGSLCQREKAVQIVSPHTYFTVPKRIQLCLQVFLPKTCLPVSHILCSLSHLNGPLEINRMFRKLGWQGQVHSALALYKSVCLVGSKKCCWLIEMIT